MVTLQACYKRPRHHVSFVRKGVIFVYSSGLPQRRQKRASWSVSLVWQQTQALRQALLNTLPPPLLNILGLELPP
jgi:hypothetical protein